MFFQNVGTHLAHYRGVITPPPSPQEQRIFAVPSASLWATLCWFSLNVCMVLVTRSNIYAPSLFLSQLTDPQKSCYTAVTVIGTCHVVFTDMTHAQCSLLFDYAESVFFFGLGSTAPSGPPSSLLRLHYHTRTRHIR